MRGGMHGRSHSNLHAQSRDQNEGGKEENERFSVYRRDSVPRRSEMRPAAAYNEQLNYGWILEESLFARGNFPSFRPLTRLALRFLSHPSMTTASIMWEIVSGADCWNRTMCARLSVSATCPRRGRRMYPPRHMSKHFSDTREYIFPRTFRIADWGMPRGKERWVTLKYHRVAATSFGKSLKQLTLGKSSYRI